MRSSYKKEDVEILLKDITGLVAPQPTEEREKLIQSGRHYSEMLPIEYSPSEKYIEAYYNALENYGKSVANAVGVLSDKIYNKKGSEVVLVSLARAGIPAGILIKRYFKFKYNCDIKHYAMSIIRGRGIDKNAIKLNHAPSIKIQSYEKTLDQDEISKLFNQCLSILEKEGLIVRK